MTLHEFWIQHADALGVAVLAAALAVVALYLVMRRYERLAAGQRAVYRAQIEREKQLLHRRYERIISALARRRPTYDEDVTQAVALSGPVRTALMEASGDLTMDEPRNPYAPLPYDGVGVTR